MATIDKKFEYLTGTIERVTYHNPENGYAVIKVKVKKHKDLVTITGNVPSVCVGEDIQAQGVWFNNVKHGLEFKANFLRSIAPNTLEGIEKYLGSGLIRGIGPFFAKKLVAAFKEDVFDVIENFPKKLNAIDGIGKVRAASIAKNWADQKVVREIMIFLQSHGVSTARATRIYKTYGENAIKIVSDNPYQLARDIKGIGFLSADKIARNLGIEEHSILRARAGINYALTEALDDGHCGLPMETLIVNAEKLLSINKSILLQAMQDEIRDGHLVDDNNIVFLKPYYIYEKNIARKLLLLKKAQPKWVDIDAGKAIEWAQSKLLINLADNQREALKTTLSSKVSVITGGPGTGKTTILKVLLKILLAKNFKIKLCAPTGRAAKRLQEATLCESFTIHRLLKFDPKKGDFYYNQNNQLDCDLLVIDESSMIDVQLCHSMLKAVPEASGLLLVGDIDQLPSVGPGQVLKDIIESQAIPTIRLNRIFRQGSESNIIASAHQVNKGMFPKLENPPESDFHFIEENEPEKITTKIVHLVKHHIPKKLKMNPITDLQVLSPMQRGGTGARSLNIELQKALNPLLSEGVERFAQIFAVGDKIMQTENNYDKDVYNGDIGFIKRVDHIEQKLYAEFDGRTVDYGFEELDELSIAYATTIHKSQGSEYSCVVIPISTQHFPMLQKNLLYTAITRGKKLVVLVGQKKAIAMAVRNNKENLRHSKLREWLRSEHTVYA